MILIATKTILNSDSVPQSINLEGSDIKLANTLRNISVCPDTSLSFQRQIPSVCRICCLEFRQTSAVRHHLFPKVSPKQCSMRLFCELNYCDSFLAGCRKYLLSKLKKGKEQCCPTHFQNTQIRHVTRMLYSLHWLPTEQKIEYKLFLCCFKVIFHQAPIYILELQYIIIPAL